jgi:carbon monoxide dehydrogenase subunit G
MRFDNAFAVEAPIDAVYAALLDVERVAPCVPGAEVLERTDDGAYKVAIKVKVGPISMTYRGSVEVVENDPEARRAVMRVRAREARGQGTADAEVQMRLAQSNGATQGAITTDVQLSGRAGSMGRGVIEDVSGRIVETFAQNLAAMLAPQNAPAAAPEPAAPEPAEEAALPVGRIVGSVIATRLRDPRVAGALAALAALLGAVHLLRRQRSG